MPVADGEYDGIVYAITDNQRLRDYHRSAERRGQTAGVVIAGNAMPPAAAGPEVRRARRPVMAPPALRQPQLQQRSNGGDAGLVSVSSRKYRYLTLRPGVLARSPTAVVYFESILPPPPYTHHPTKNNLLHNDTCRALRTAHNKRI